MSFADIVIPCRPVNKQYLFVTMETSSMVQSMQRRGIWETQESKEMRKYLS